MYKMLNDLVTRCAFRWLLIRATKVRKRLKD